MPKGGFDIIGTVLKHCYGRLTKAVIPDGVTEIADGAFACNKYVKNVIIPDSVTRIGNRAFGWCENLSKINIPDSVTEIGERAFIDCGFLREIRLGKNVEELGRCAFWLCSNLKTVVLSPKLKRIRCNTFWDCIRLSRIETGGGITVIEKEAFLNTNLSNFDLSDKLEEIGDFAFKNSGAHRIEIPASVKRVGKKIADGCDYFTMFECYPEEKPDGWDEEWNIVNGKKPFTVWDFANSNGVVGKYDKSQLFIDGSVLKNCSKEAKEVYVPDGVTTLDDNAFNGCKQLEKLSLPASLRYICDDVFSLDSDIKIFEYRGTVREWCDISFYDTFANPMQYADKIFIDGSELLSLDIPDGVTEIKSFAFMGICVNDITLPESIAEISDYAFSHCADLEKINFPRGLKTIGVSAFWGCYSLSEITLSRSTEVKDDAFDEIDNLKINYTD